MTASAPAPPAEYLQHALLTAFDIAWHMRCHATALHHEWITPNVLLYAWESDLLTVTPEGFVCEVEIKVSRSDLKNDLRKPKHSGGMLLNGTYAEKTSGRSRTRNEEHEHRRMKAGAPLVRRPNYFCFAMPCEVYRRPSPPRIPPYAGVYTVDEEGRVFEERRPIQLHSGHIAQEDLLMLAKRMHHRYWEELRRAQHAPGTPVAQD